MSSKMSHDRVHFTIFEKYLNKQTIRNCIHETLGIRPNELPRVSKYHNSGYKDLHVICRPSQFARFVIQRHVKYGEPSNMSCLNMKLVQPEECKPLIDASDRPANNCD